MKIAPVPGFLMLMLSGMFPAITLANPPKTFTLADHSPPTDGTTDATEAFQRLFAEVAKAGGGNVVIPRGTYHLPGKSPVKLTGGTHVTATGAKFTLPAVLGDQARVVVFQGENIRDFSWTGGEFLGKCFDPAAATNTWEPNANTRMFVITTTADGDTSDILFRDVKSDGIAGAVISVFGFTKPGSESEVIRHAKRVTVENCTLLNSGKFMWDYGYLWQITGWPEDYSPAERAMAAKYFPAELIRGGIAIADGDNRVMFANDKKPLPVAKTGEPKEAICFFGDSLPKNIVRGRQYFIVASEADHVKIAETPGGQPIRFEGAAGANTRMVHDLFRAFMLLYSPVGAGPGKGGVDLVACKTVRMTGCILSARGDTMHIQRSDGVVFADNQIVGSRMGAFFLAEYCKNAVITGNTIDGTNGSRVMSVEKSCADVTITGNTFRNGGRGSWINQPKNFVLQGNVFVNNTTKCEKDPKRGRRSFVTGEYESYAEVYFTLHQKDGAYDSVIVRGNIFDTGPECGPAITFAKNGRGLVVTENIFKGAGREIRVDPSCQEVLIRDNLGQK